MSVGHALRAALRDVYAQPLRLVALNMAVTGAGLLVAAAAAVAPAAVVLGVALGPLLAALVHCEVGLVRSQELALGCALQGLRLHWRRGVALACAGAVVTGLGVFGVVFYARAGGAAVPLAFLAAYLVALLAVVQLLAWPLAVAEPGRSLLEAVRLAAVTMLRRPGPVAWLALVLLLVNLLGIAFGAMPFLTVTIAYTFLVATRFVLPPEEVTP